MNDSKIPYLILEDSNQTGITLCNSPDKVSELLELCFRLKHQAEEHVVMIAVNAKTEPLAVFEISHGKTNAALFSIKNILTRALLSGAYGIFVAHNHPSGHTTPSIEDKLCCNQLKEACHLMEIELIDFIIVGDNYKSFREENLL